MQYRSVCLTGLDKRVAVMRGCQENDYSKDIASYLSERRDWLLPKCMRVSKMFYNFVKWFTFTLKSNNIRHTVTTFAVARLQKGNWGLIMNHKRVFLY